MQNLTNLVKYLLFVLALITSIACSAKTATIDKAAEDATKTKLAIEFVQVHSNRLLKHIKKRQGHTLLCLPLHNLKML